LAKITYHVVRHDGGWAYRVDETFSEPFPTHDAARTAAQLAAKEQAQPGDSVEITFEDKQGKWHTELAPGKDRPEIDVDG
jgi:predicted secreted protein